MKITQMIAAATCFVYSSAAELSAGSGIKAEASISQSFDQAIIDAIWELDEGNTIGFMGALRSCKSMTDEICSQLPYLVDEY